MTCLTSKATLPLWSYTAVWCLLLPPDNYREEAEAGTAKANEPTHIIKVSGVSPNARAEHLYEIFSEFVNVPSLESVNLIQNPHLRKHIGIALISLSSEQDTKTAICYFHRVDYLKKFINIFAGPIRRQKIISCSL
mgnify:CR=1 FL=1